MAARQLFVSPRISTASGAQLAQRGVGARDDVADGLGRGRAGRLQIPVGRPQLQILEEHLAELVVVVLAGVHQHVIEVTVEGGDAPATGG